MKFKWTPTKIIVTILIVAFFFFILFQAGAFDKITEQFLTTSPSFDIPLSSSSSGGSSGGGIS